MLVTSSGYLLRNGLLFLDPEFRKNNWVITNWSMYYAAVTNGAVGGYHNDVEQRLSVRSYPGRRWDCFKFILEQNFSRALNFGQDFSWVVNKTNTNCTLWPEDYKIFCIFVKNLNFVAGMTRRFVSSKNSSDTFRIPANSLSIALKVIKSTWQFFFYFVLSLYKHKARHKVSRSTYTANVIWKN